MDAGMTNAADKIIVALDVATKEKALALVKELRDRISFFKIGLQLYTAEGPEIVRAVLATGAKVWLDIKLYDIPNTVGRAVESANNLGVHMLTIHLSGGSEMIAAASAARANSMLLLGVTVLTSATEQTLREIGVSGKMDEQVMRLARLGVEAGIDGVVASPRSNVQATQRDSSTSLRFARNDNTAIHRASHLPRQRPALVSNEHGHRRSAARARSRSINSLLSMALPCSFVWILWKICRCR